MDDTDRLRFLKNEEAEQASEGRKGDASGFEGARDGRHVTLTLMGPGALC